MRSISQREFAAFQRLMYESVGIHLSDAKKALVTGRLAQRVRACGMDSYGQYLRLLVGGDSPAELQTALDLLTTNETYFFREPKHFEFLRARVDERRSTRTPFRTWSAATSSGEEAYSIAMVLEDVLPGRWEVIASDVSVRALARARAGHYRMDRLTHFPAGYLRRFCLKGVGARTGGMLRVARQLREQVEFCRVNLNESLPSIGSFDVIFLRNVLIYFNVATRREVIRRVLGRLKSGGHLLIGHAETLTDVTDALERLGPAVYRKPA